MKNKFVKIPVLLCSILLFSALKSFAQSDEKIWSFGPEVGAAFSKYGGDASDTKFRTGILLGVGLTYSIQRTYGVTTRILYVQKGAKEGDTKSSLKYIEIPVVGRFFLNREGKCRPNIFVGPSFGFLTGAASKTGSGDNVQLKNYKDYFNTFDFGVTGGLGLNWLIANETHLILDARYTGGLSDISKAAGKVTNQSIAVSAGVTFGL